MSGFFLTTYLTTRKIFHQTKKGLQFLEVLCARDKIRTYTPERALPSESSVSTNSTTRAFRRAKDGARTRDPNLGKVVLYQLSYFRKIDA